MIRVELLSADNFKPDSLDNYPRKHDVKKVYRKHNGKYILVDCVYTEDWDMAERRSIAKAISSDDYITYLAIENDEVVGFIGLKKALVEPYMILDMMQVWLPAEDRELEESCLIQGKKKQGRQEQRPCIFLHVHLKKLLLFIKLWELNSQIVR